MVKGKRVHRSATSPKAWSSASASTPAAAAVGEVGWNQTGEPLTAIGDAVNTAGDPAAGTVTSSTAVRLVVSERVLQGAGVDTTHLARHTVAVRGRAEDLAIYAIASPGDMELENPGA